MTTTSRSEITAHELSHRELAAWRGMLRTHAALTKGLDAELEAAHNLSLSSYEVLLHVSSAPEQRMRMSELAESVVLSRSGLTRLVDRMERDGLLARESCPSDARGAFARLTDAGASKLALARVTHLDGVRARFLDRLSADELDALAAIWERIQPGSAAAGGGPACS